MKNSIKLLSLLALGLVFILTSCSKENTSSKDEDLYKSIANEEADFILKDGGSFEKVITKRLVKRDDCRFIVAGTIEFYKNGRLAFIIDFGEGRCDDLATITRNGETYEISLLRLRKAGEYDKVIVEPLVKLEDCEYIVSGIVEFYKGDTWVATFDFGDGTCDEWATKTWDGGSKVFSMKK
jgi:hypothetical protein